MPVCALHPPENLTGVTISMSPSRNDAYLIYMTFVSIHPVFIHSSSVVITIWFSPKLLTSTSHTDSSGKIPPVFSDRYLHDTSVPTSIYPHNTLLYLRDTQALIDENTVFLAVFNSWPWQTKCLRIALFYFVPDYEARRHCGTSIATLLLMDQDTRV